MLIITLTGKQIILKQTHSSITGMFCAQKHIRAEIRGSKPSLYYTHFFHNVLHSKLWILDTQTVQWVYVRNNFERRYAKKPPHGGFLVCAQLSQRDIRYNRVMLHRYAQHILQSKLQRGIIVLDKESGITSHDEVDRLRKIFNVRKIGHSGTLDPKVSGVLVCGTGRGTKVLEYVLLSEKVYDCEIIFHHPVTQTEFVAVMNTFKGDIAQLPPTRSRVKRVVRMRTIYDLELLSWAGDGRRAVMRCRVERGTYIRKLCHDMGQTLQDRAAQPIGAHMGDLRRIQAGPFDERHPCMVTSRQLKDLARGARGLWAWWYLWRLGRYVVAIEEALAGIGKVTVHPSLARVLASGAPLYAPGVLGADNGIHKGDAVQIQDTRGQVLAMGTAVIKGEEMKSGISGTAVEVNKILCHR